MKDKSPRSIPRTQQDVDRAYDKGQEEGMEKGAVYALTLISFLLREDFAATDEHITQINERFNFYTRQIKKGELKFNDVKDALKSDYKTAVHIR